MKKAIKILSLSLLGLLGVVSCGDSSSNEASYIDTTSNSPYGKITDFSISQDESMNAGDTLTFKVNPAEDFLIDTVTVNGEPASVVIGAEENTYSWTLVAGENRIAATYKIDPSIDFVDEFKLQVSDEDWAHVVNASGPSGDGYDFRQDGLELVRTQHLKDEGVYQSDEAPFINYVDGDTTHVETLKYGYTVKIRYLGIDTPESSSDLEEWGKTAALYNQEQLSNANYILLQSQGRANNDPANYPSTLDGNGRNLAYVWYSNFDGPFKELTPDSFRCLNLEMVYQGLSQGIGSVEETGENYYFTFDKANKSAEANARHEYSNERDPNYCYALPTNLTLEEIYEDSGSSHGATNSKYKDEQTLYRISGYVSRKIEGAFYFQNFPDYTYGDSLYWDTYGEEGYNEEHLPTKAYGMYVFTYRQTPIDVGDYVSVIGVLTDYGGSYQMSGISYSQLNPNKDRDTLIDASKSVGMSGIKPISLTAEQFKEMEYNNVLVSVSDTLYPYNATTKANGGGYTVVEGGLYEVNKYNTTYPFYNDNNKITLYADIEEGSTKSSYDTYRITIPDEILLAYNGVNAYTFRFFTGGTCYYNSDGADKLNIITNADGDTALVNVDDPFVDEEDPLNQSLKYEAKSLNVTAISTHYLSTTGGTDNYTLNIVSRGDVVISEL